MSSFADLEPFIAGNQQWAAATHSANPEFLPTLAKAQQPSILWFGCSDSRVPESTIMLRKPGDVFVHRNIANLFQADDASAHAVLRYAVLHVGVAHVVVVGHSACGGCKTAFASPAPKPDADAAVDPLLRFLDPLIKIRHSLPPDATLTDLTCESVRQSVANVVNSATMKEAWAQGPQVFVHGWVYDIATGLIDDKGLTHGPPS